MPIDMNVWLGALKGFEKSHQHCKDTGRKPTEFDRHNWAASRDTGVSSFTIYTVMTGVPFPYSDYDIPYDPADFGRCYRLLKLAPDFRERLPEVAAKFPIWKPFVEAWDELTALYEEEIQNASGMAPKLYARMKEIRATIGK